MIILDYLFIFLFFILLLNVAEEVLFLVFVNFYGRNFIKGADTSGMHNDPENKKVSKQCNDFIQDVKDESGKCLG